MSKCDHCAAEFSCSRLALALNVAEASPDLSQRPKLARAIAAVKTAIEGGGWSYPAGEGGCVFMRHPEMINRRTQELIEALCVDRSGKSQAFESLLEEERSCD